MLVSFNPLEEPELVNDEVFTNLETGTLEVDEDSYNCDDWCELTNCFQSRVSRVACFTKDEHGETHCHIYIVCSDYLAAIENGEYEIIHPVDAEDDEDSSVVYINGEEAKGVRVIDED